MQFGIRQLLGATSAVAVLCAISVWLHGASRDVSLDWIPPLIIPSIPMMGFFMMLMLLVCLPSFIALIVLILKNAPRPYTAIVFLGLPIVGMTVDISYWSNGLRLVAVMLAAAIAMAIEIYIRKLPPVYLVCSGLTFVFTIGWYFATIGIYASASV